MDEPTLTKKERRALAKETKHEEKAKSLMFEKVKKLLIALGILGVVAYAGIRTWAWIQTPTDIPTDVTQITETDWMKGNPDAKVTLIEYADFQCPACGSYYPLVKQLGEDFPEDLRIIYRNFPLTQIHPNAHPAAQAAEAAGMQGKFWEMTDLLFTKQKDWSTESNPESIFENYAKELELDVDKYKSDYKSNEVSAAIAADVVLANKTGVNATPTFILNGVQIKGPQSYDAFKALVEAEIQK